MTKAHLPKPKKISLPKPATKASLPKTSKGNKPPEGSKAKWRPW